MADGHLDGNFWYDFENLGPVLMRAIMARAIDREQASKATEGGKLSKKRKN